MNARRKKKPVRNEEEQEEKGSEERSQGIELEATPLESMQEVVCESHSSLRGGGSSGEPEDETIGNSARGTWSQGPREKDLEDGVIERALSDREREQPELVEGIEFDQGILEHVRMVTSLIEGFEVKREEVIEMLQRAVRQHSIVRERRVDYVVRSLGAQPP